MPLYNPSRALSLIVFCLALWVQHAVCIGIKFTLPAPGATWPAGPISINWTDAGGVPDMSNLTTYSLALIVGGITPTDSTPIATIAGNTPGAMVKDGGVEANIPTNIGQSIQNGYYLCMTANTTNGNQVINYSSRFTIINMNGTTDEVYLAGAAASVGDNNVPAPQQIVLAPPPKPTTSPSQTSTTASATSAAATSPSATSHGSGEQYSISGGALAGLAIGTLSAGVLFLILIAMTLIWWRRRRRLRRFGKRGGSGEEDNKQQPDTALQNWGDKVELSARPNSTVSRSLASPAELSPDQERHEMGGSADAAAELSATKEMVYELEGDFSGWEMAARRSRHAAYDPTL